MKVRHLVAVVAAAVAVASAVPSHAAHSARGEYHVTAGTPVLSVTCAPNCADTGLNLGGYTFAAGDGLGEVPRSVTVADASGTPIGLVVCQDFNGLRCGETGEPRVVGCGGTLDLTKSDVPFKADTAVSVFTRAVDACAGIGSSGTITLTFG